jgi:hypothetical protein
VTTRPKQRPLLELHKRTERIELEKRQHAPYTVVDACPKCGHDNEVNLARDHYLSYPIAGKPEEVYHVCSRCEHEWQTKVIVRITLELAPR